MLQIVHDVAPGASWRSPPRSTASGELREQHPRPARCRRRRSSSTTSSTSPSRCSRTASSPRPWTTSSAGRRLLLLGRQRRAHGLRARVRAGNALRPAPTAASFLGGIPHAFSGTTNDCSECPFAKGTTVIVLQWDSPFFSVSGRRAPTNDLDIYLFDRTARTPSRRRASPTNNIASGDPVETSGPIQCPLLSSCSVHIMIVSHSGLHPGRLKYRYSHRRLSHRLSPALNSGTIYGHANAAGRDRGGRGQLQDADHARVVLLEGHHARAVRHGGNRLSSAGSCGNSSPRSWRRTAPTRHSSSGPTPTPRTSRTSSGRRRPPRTRPGWRRCCCRRCRR